MEDAIYDSDAMRRFTGLDFAVGAGARCHHAAALSAPAGDPPVGERLFAAQDEIFAEQGWIMRGGSIVDATMIAAPSSTKNAVGERDRQMYQTKKGNQ